MKTKNILGIILLIGILAVSIGVVSADDGSGQATTTDKFTYYGLDTPAGQDYTYSIEVDGNVYYFDDSIASEIDSNNLNQVIKWDLSKYGSSEPDAQIKTGLFTFDVYDQPNEDYSQFSFDCDKIFTFTYHTGTVGMNDNAKIIDSVTVS